VRVLGERVKTIQRRPDVEPDGVGKMEPDRRLWKCEDNADLDYSIACSIDIRINTGDDG
jgi:hypothetical protein